ncbi:Bacteriophage HK97-gp10, putative tail-component [uncultured Caudovirales phage]|uniref:Bacteriophage HK97-gp10, putative tail-component n=1 Tax=uncultured Caudovirales phage TaxID=2100421 RepID=A0A6J5MQ13_9CAUD|nr:Bacteriophage HK97-gp10, putative tail-component [uncultured Caudovirales phage]
MELQVKGLDTLIKKFDKLAKDAKVEVQAELNAWADATSTNAKSLVSANSSDEGALLRSISPLYGDGTASVVASAKYAAYIEFGTRKYAAAYVSTLPADWQAYAATFKGKAGGDYYDFLNAILDWVQRKGITARYSVKTKKRLRNSKADDERLVEAAQAIALSILRNGIQAKPFLYPSVNKTLPTLKKKLRAIFKL